MLHEGFLPAGSREEYPSLHSKTCNWIFGANPTEFRNAGALSRIAYFEFHQPKGAQIIRHRFIAKVWEMTWDVSSKRIRLPHQWPPSFAAYLRDVDGLAQRDDFRTILEDIGANQPLRANALFVSMNWIENRLTYDHVNASPEASAEHAFDQRRGHCSDYHGLCATMGRNLGVPTRVAYGLNHFPKNSPSHCKLEAFLPLYGWVPFDLSETQKMLARIEQCSEIDSEQKRRRKTLARKRLKRGFRDNTWLAVTRGTDYEVVPKASQPINVVRTIYAEADGEPLPEPDPANIKQREFQILGVVVGKPHSSRLIFPDQGFLWQINRHALAALHQYRTNSGIAEDNQFGDV